MNVESVHAERVHAERPYAKSVNAGSSAPRTSARQTSLRRPQRTQPVHIEQVQAATVHTGSGHGFYDLMGGTETHLIKWGISFNTKSYSCFTGSVYKFANANNEPALIRTKQKLSKPLMLL